MTNPALDEQKNLCSLHCEPLIQPLADAVGISVAGMEFGYGEGGPGMYQIGMYAAGAETGTIFFFGRTDIGVRPDGAKDFKMFAAVNPRDRLVIALPEISADFMDILNELHEGDVLYAKAADDPWFTAVPSPGVPA